MEKEGSNIHTDNKAKLDYLKELLTDRAILSNYPGIYLHVGKILEKEILKVRSALFETYGIYSISESDLPEPEGPKVNLVTRVYMPTGENSSFNFVGRILGPDGSTAKCLQQCLGVKLMVRGRGSMRDRKKEEANIGKPSWEHLNDKLHIVLTVEDYENRAQARLDKASEYISLFLKESMKTSDREDKVKQMQLMELSFRREPRATWPVNCNGLFNFNVPFKPGVMFPNANPVGYGYSFAPPAGPAQPAPTLFSPLHHNPSHQHPNPFGPMTGNQPGMAGHPGAQPHAPMGSLTHSFTSALSPGLNPTVLMGHAPGVPYASSHMSSGTSVTATAQPGPSTLPGTLAMASMNYWPGATSGLAHMSSPDYSVQTQIPTHNHHHSTTNGFMHSVGPEQVGADGFSTNGSHGGGLCNVFLTSPSVTQASPPQQQQSAVGQPHLVRGHEEPMQGGLLADFVSCSVATKDQDPGVSESRTPSSMQNALSGLYAPPPTTVATPASNALKLSTALRSGPSPPPPSSFAAKQGLKPRYFQKSNQQHTGYHSSASGQSHRAARNAVVAIKVGSKDKQGELISNGSRTSATFDRTKNGTSVGSGAGKGDGGLSKPDKKFAAHSTSKLQGKHKSAEPDWHKLDSDALDKQRTDTDRHSTSVNASLDQIDQRMLDLSLMSDASVPRSTSELVSTPTSVENAK